MTTTLPTVEIRPMATPDDVRDARAMLAAQRSWLASLDIDISTAQPDGTGDYADPAGAYTPPEGLLLIARRNGQPCGIVALVRLAERAGAVELRRMYVLESARGAGAGRGLLTAAVHAARKLGYREVWLETAPALMPTAAGMYAAAGFRPAPALGHTDVPGLVTMRLPITRSSPSP